MIQLPIAVGQAPQSLGVIIGAVVGSVIVLALVVVLVSIFILRKIQVLIQFFSKITI